MDPDKMSEQELRREVKALREGKCRLNCRSVKEAFYAGFTRGANLYYFDVDPDPEDSYKEWNHERP